MKSFGAVGEFMGRVDTPTPGQVDQIHSDLSLATHGKSKDLTASGARTRVRARDETLLGNPYPEALTGRFLIYKETTCASPWEGVDSVELY